VASREPEERLHPSAVVVDRGDQIVAVVPTLLCVKILFIPIW
jgi:hypothetical protein